MDRSGGNKKVDDIPEDVSLGHFLRRSREERHVELDEVVRVTRIRRHNLEALENEEWSKLPSEVFVKGFLRSYAEFLGLDKERVLDYFQRSSRIQKYKPQILKEISLEPRRWHLALVVPVLALTLIASIIYLKRYNISVVEKVFQYLEPRSMVEKKESTAGEEVTKGRYEKKKQEVFRSDEKAVGGEKQAASSPESGREALVLGGSATSVEIEEEKLPSQRLVLTANVNSRTWIAMYIDDEPVKEYVFQPGETFRWTAKKGFDILVGNAGGIEFFLNGKEVGRLGPEGRVVRLKLPADL